MRKIGKNSLTDKIFDCLIEKSKDLFDLSLVIMFDPRELTKGMGLYRNYNARPLSQKIYDLRKSPYFKFKDDKFYLTKKGRMEIIRKIIKKKKEDRKKWNGKWMGIMFDIPEVNRRERCFLRKELRWIGCKEVQKSVWLTPLDIEKELLTILELWKNDFKGDIKFFKIDKITDHKKLQSYFKI